MGLISDLNVVDPIVNNNLPPINDSSANAGVGSFQTPYNPPQVGVNFISNFSTPQRNFLDALSEYGASIPIKSFWVMQFKIPSLITESNLNDLSEKFKENDFAKLTLSNPKFMRNVGCIFCRSFAFAGENNNSSVPEMDIRGFRSVPIAGGRSSGFLQNFSLTFYESSVSFIDHILRPWTILISYYSTIARNNADQTNSAILDLKQDITCHLMTRTGVAKNPNQQSVNQQLNGSIGNGIPNYNNPWNVRKSIVFKNCFPKDFGVANYVQTDSNSLETVAATFCFTNYEITFNSNLFEPPNIFRKTEYATQSSIANQGVA